MAYTTRNELNELLAECRRLREENPDAFAMVRRHWDTGEGYPALGSQELKIVQRHDRLSARAARFATGF
jgi:hypothetical protein